MAEGGKVRIFLPLPPGLIGGRGGLGLGPGRGRGPGRGLGGRTTEKRKSNFVIKLLMANQMRMTSNHVTRSQGVETT